LKTPNLNDDTLTLASHDPVIPVIVINRLEDAVSAGRGAGRRWRDGAGSDAAHAGIDRIAATLTSHSGFRVGAGARAVRHGRWASPRTDPAVSDAGRFHDF
jgi:hypothetical protein